VGTVRCCVRGSRTRRSALEFSGSRPLAFVTALSLNPALFLYEAYPLYTLLAAFLLVLTLFCLELFSLGKRWGPRYLLIPMPIISLLATLMLDATLKISKAGWRYAGSALFVLLFILGTYRNTYLGRVSLRDDYRERVLPALDLVQQHESRVVGTCTPRILRWFWSQSRQTLPARPFTLVGTTSVGRMESRSRE